MAFCLSKLSGDRLQGVHPDLVRVVERAIQITTQDLGSRQARERVSAVADPFNGYIDEFRISHVQRSDGWIETTWNKMSDSGAFAVAGVEEQEGGEPHRSPAPVWSSASWGQGVRLVQTGG